MKPLSRQNYKKNARVALDKLGLKGVSSLIIQDGTAGAGVIGLGKRLPLPVKVQEYTSNLNSVNKQTISNESVKTYSYFFVRYENQYLPKGDEVLYSFSVIKTLSPVSVNKFSSMIAIKDNNITGLTEAEYLINSFPHPIYINQKKELLSFRYSEISYLEQTTPGRLDDVPLGYPAFNYNKSAIRTQKGMLPQPPYPNFQTDEGYTGGTAFSVGGTAGFVDTSLTIPSILRPVSWSWDFGGTSASPTGSTAQNPTVTFNAIGEYTVTLTASNANGSQSIIKTNFITVT